MSEFCERCFRGINHLAPDPRKISEGLVSDLVERILIEQGYVPAMKNMKLGELYLFPDLYVCIQGVHLIIEIDEHQHKRQRETDKTRTAMLKKKFAPLVLIRINPDTYRGRVPMIHITKELDEEGRIKKTISLHSGEIATRDKNLRDVILPMIIQIHTDHLLGTPHAPFTEIFMFYDLYSVVEQQS
jgi:hypothetical protein